MPNNAAPGASTNIRSYSWIHTDLASKSQAFADKFSQFVIDYAVEWDRITSARVANGVKVTDALRRDLDHYQKKVESLRQSVNVAMAKGKNVDNKTQDKLARNEEKFVKAKSDYDKVALDMCMLLEEYTERSWKDLHPALVKLAQFDSTVANEEATSLKSLDQVVQQLKAIGDQHGIKAAGRLKDLESTPPSQLYSKEGGLQMLANAPANGDGTMGSGGDPFGSAALTPGSVAPQGMGGYPVTVGSAVDAPPPVPPIASPVAGTYTRQGSVASFDSSSYGAPNSGNISTSAMLAVANSSAPPPTLDQVNDATASMSIGASPFGQPSPAATGGFGNNSFHRSSSVASDDSYPYGQVAAPPAAPPPPPPPPGGMSMYSSSGGAPPPYAQSAPAPAAYGGYGAPAPATNPFSPAGSANPFDPPGAQAPPPAAHNPFGY